MPRPRFEKLSIQKRERILEAAAKEFAAHGYDNASLNRILEAAEISKGAAYYYFDGKADLYTTTVLHFGQEMMESVVTETAPLTAENFWDELTAIYRHNFTAFAERPWVFGVAKTGGPMPSTLATEGPLAGLWEQAQVMLGQLLRRGRELGVVRDDMPEELLLSLVISLDDAHDRWLLGRWSELSAADLDEAAVRIAGCLRRLLSPN